MGELTTSNLTAAGNYFFLEDQNTYCVRRACAT